MVYVNDTAGTDIWLRIPSAVAAHGSNSEMPDTNKRKRRAKEAAGDGASPSSAAAAAATAFDRCVFPLLLAAAARTTRRTQRSSSSAAAAAAATAVRILRRVLPSLSPLPDSLVAVFPLLLASSSASVASLSCEVLGAAALQSMEASEMLAADAGIANGLARALGSGSQRVAEAACNATMDLSASSVSRNHLAGSAVLPSILYLFSQMESISGVIDSRSTECSKSANEPNKGFYLIVNTLVLMVNSCQVDSLRNLQHDLVRKVLHWLYKIWKKTGTMGLSTDCINSKNQLQSREHDISEAIFRLSMNIAYAAYLEPDEIRRSIFGQSVSDYENFLLNYWEKSTYLLTGKQKNLEEDSAFTSLLNEFDPKTPDAIIQSLLNGIVSCPAIASDELDISSFLHEVHGFLGASAKYMQDIRVVRTRDQCDHTSRVCRMEEHFFNDGTAFLDADAFVEKCKDAFANGFSVALRGMEFRSEKIAAIASAVADLFGQPSVGANIYFSPPGSQGLARHYDDHCVLVWQLLGCKKWMVWPNAKLILPRLYEPFESVDDLVGDGGGRMEVLVEGSIMYVPRGFVHEAHTDVDVGEFQVNSTANCSLHLTLAIEVEPPFEWEGFAHIALRCWMEEHYVKSKVEEQISLFTLLLHVAIRLLSEDDVTFRKACLVAAKLPPSSSCTTHLEALKSKQRSIFDEIIEKIDKSCSFKEALRCIELAVKEKNDEPFQWMCWFRHLPQHGDANNKVDFCNILGALEELLEAVSCNLEQAFTEFMDFKSRFCRCIVYEDACGSFEMLLQMYRTSRNQYMRGMLALHGKYEG